MSRTIAIEILSLALWMPGCTETRKIQDEPVPHRSAASQPVAKDTKPTTTESPEPAAQDRGEGRATRQQCQKLAAKVARLMEQKTASKLPKTATDTEGSRVVRSLKAKVLAELRSSFTTQCLKRWAADRAACALRVGTLEAIGACKSAIDLRPAGDRPTKASCKELGAHMGAILRRRLSGAQAKSKRLLGMVTTISRNAVLECERDLTKTEVACRMKARTIDDLKTCTPGARRLDDIVGEALNKLIQPVLDTLGKPAGEKEQKTR